MGKLGQRTPLVTRLFAKVRQDDMGTGCWEWHGYRNQYGYGLITTGGDHGKLILTHRAVFRALGLEEPPDPKTGIVVNHLCNNPPCLNPAHLNFITQRENCVTLCDSPYGINARKTHCIRGHPFAGENLARVLMRYRVSGKWNPTRVCLTCYPHARNHPRRFWLPEDLPGIQIERVA